MKGIEINGEKLHEVRLRQKSYTEGSSVYLGYPKSRIHYCFENGDEFVEVPALLAVELYKRGILPRNQDDFLRIKESGKKVGNFLIEQVLYPDSTYMDKVRFILKKA